MQVLMGTRENAALFGLLLCLPTAPTLPLSSQDTGTSGWQLVDKATLLARIGKGGGPMSLAGTYRSSTEGRSGSAFGTRADQVFLGPSVWAATIPVSILIISVRFRSIAVVGRSRRVLWRRVFRSGRIRVLWIGRVVITGRIIISLPCCTARQQ